MNVLWGARRGDRVLAVEVPAESLAARGWQGASPRDEWWCSSFQRLIYAGWTAFPDHANAPATKERP